MYYSIAIDGPAGAGKSTIAKEIAKKIHFIYVDTGAMYRAIALYFLREGIDGHDTERISEECPKIRVTLGYDGEGRQQVFLNGENVTPLSGPRKSGRWRPSQQRFLPFARRFSIFREIWRVHPIF